MIDFTNKTISVVKSSISFVGKTIEVPKTIPGKRIRAKVIWKNLDNKFVAKIDKVYYDIEGYNDLTNVKWVYALPTNTFFPCWFRKPYEYNKDIDPDVLAMTLRFWGKYREGMSIYGKIIDNIFCEIKHINHTQDESSISETTG